MCCAGIGDSGSFSTRGGADLFAAVLFDAPPFFADFVTPFLAPCLFVFFAISSPLG
jgi:hypothetical protein